jgi:hypothetical protein
MLHLSAAQGWTMIVKVHAPTANPNATWLVFGDKKVFSAVYTKGSIPQNVQNAVVKGKGSACFVVTISGKHFKTWGAQVMGQRF